MIKNYKLNIKIFAFMLLICFSLNAISEIIFFFIKNTSCNICISWGMWYLPIAFIIYVAFSLIFISFSTLIYRFPILYPIIISLIVAILHYFINSYHFKILFWVLVFQLLLSLVIKYEKDII